MSELEFQVLGPLRATRNGVPIDLRGDRLRAVLALLLVRVNRVVPPAVFADEVWGREDYDATANLQVVVSNLRKALGSTTITTHPGGYVVATDRLDAARFRGHRTLGHEARTRGDARAAAASYHAAELEWSGDRALQDLASIPFADAFAQAMEQDLVDVVSRRVEAELALGMHQELLGDLVAHTQRWPLDTQLCQHLLVALCRSGRDAAAAEQYHAFRERYDAELGAQVPDTLRGAWAALARGQHVAGPYDTAPADDLDDRTDVADDEPPDLTAELHGSDGMVHPLGGRRVLGRSADIAIVDRQVSKTHAVVAATPSGFVVNDLGSTNGTFVNEEPVLSPRLLVEGDVLRLGSTSLVFRLVAQPTNPSQSW